MTAYGAPIIPPDRDEIRSSAGSSASSHARLGGESERLTPLREMQLIDEYRLGDRTAIEAILRGYQHRIYAICLRMVSNRDDAADLTQDVLLKVMDRLDTYDGRSALSTWVIRVTMNHCISFLRKQRLRRHASLDAGGGGPSGDGHSGVNPPDRREPSGPERVERSERQAMVLAALDDLEPDVRALLVLRDVQGLDYQEIADVLEAPLGTVKSRLFRARAALRTAVEDRTRPERSG